MSTFQKSLIFVFSLGVLYLIYLLLPVLTPFLIAAFLAYLGNPLVKKLEKLKLSQPAAAITVFTVILLLLIGSVVLVVPLLAEQIQMLIEKLPAMIGWIQETVIPWLDTHLDITANFDLASVKNVLMSHWEQAGNVADKVVKTASHSAVVVFQILLNLVLIPVVTFYLLRDFPHVVARMKDTVPRKNISTVSELLRQCNEVLGAFFRGQLLVMLALGVIYFIGLKIIGLELALLIGLLIALLSLVPYLGTVVGLILAVTATAIQFHDVTHVVYVLILFFAGHLLEGMVLTPLLIGDKIGLHPVAVIFAILAGGALFGFFGVLLALPVAAVFMVIFKYFYKKYRQSDFYKK